VALVLVVDACPANRRVASGSFVARRSLATASLPDAAGFEPSNVKATLQAAREIILAAKKVMNRSAV